MPRQTQSPPARRCALQQIDLFAGGSQKTTGSMPVWSGLPAEIQAALTELMTRLILDYAGNNRIGSTTETDHDL